MAGYMSMRSITKKRNVRTSFTVEELERRRLLSAVVAATGPQLAPARREAPALAVDGLIHTTGLLTSACGPAAATVGDLALFADIGTSNVDIYNASTGQWSTAQLSQARDGMAAVSVGDKAIFAGGYYFRHHGNVICDSDAVDIFHGRTGRWSTVQLSGPRPAVSVITVGTKVLFAGGIYYIGDTGTDSSVVDIYDYSTGKWSVSALSQPGSGLHPTAVGDLTMFTGLGDLSNVIDIYNAANGQWTTATLSQGRGGMGITTVGDLTIFAGGSPGAPGYSNAVDIYNSATAQWSVSSLPTALLNMGAVTVGSDAIFGGGDSLEPGGNESNVVEIYNADTNRWSATTFLTGARDSVAAVKVGSTALFAGGSTGYENNAGASDAVDFFTAPDLSGGIARPETGKVTVTLANPGASALPGPDSVAIYASTSRTLDGSAVLLGSERLRRTLIAGAKEQVSVSISIPRDLPAGQYHLIAAAGPAGQLVQFASTRRTFALAPVPVTARPDAAAVGLFNTNWLINDFPDVLF